MAYAAYATDDVFAAYLHRVLNRAGFADALGWSVAADDYDDIINETLRRMSVDAITAVTTADDLAALHMIGRAELWRQVAEATVGERDTTFADGSKAAMSQIHQHALRMAAEAEAHATGAGYAPLWYRVGFSEVAHRHDPYAAYDVEDD